MKQLKARVLVYDMVENFIVLYLVDDYALKVEDFWYNHAAIGVNLFKEWSKIYCQQAILFQRDSYDNCVENEDIVSFEQPLELFVNSCNGALIKRIEGKTRLGWTWTRQDNVPEYLIWWDVQHEKCCHHLVELYMRLYCFILYVVFFSVSLRLGCFLFSRFTVLSLIFTPKHLIFTPISCATLVSTRGTAHGARWGGRGTCVARRCPQPSTWCYPGVKFNLPELLPIPYHFIKNFSKDGIAKIPNEMFLSLTQRVNNVCEQLAEP